MIKRIFNILPDLVGLSIPEVTLDSVPHLQECASNDGSLRVLHLGKLRMDGPEGCLLATRVGGLLQSLTDLQELSIDVYCSEVNLTFCIHSRTHNICGCEGAHQS